MFLILKQVYLPFKYEFNCIINFILIFINFKKKWIDKDYKSKCFL